MDPQKDMSFLKTVRYWSINPAFEFEFDTDCSPYVFRPLQQEYLRFTSELKDALDYLTNRHTHMKSLQIASEILQIIMYYEAIRAVGIKYCLSVRQ